MAPSPETVTEDQAFPELPEYKHLILGPVDGDVIAPASQTDVLLVIAPGAFIAPEAFTALGREVQAACPHLRLWVASMEISAMALHQMFCPPNLLMTGPGFEAAGANMARAGVPAKLILQALAAAEAAGFRPEREEYGRLSNMVLMAHSASGALFPDAGRSMAAALVLLATPLYPPNYTQRKATSIETWPRPLMMMSGEVDGQTRWPWLAPEVAEVGAMAAKMGPSWVARNRPVLILPGLNHGNTSSGEARVVRGDITEGVGPHVTAMKNLGGPLAAFLTTHMAPAKDARERASLVLEAAIRHTASLTAPYCRAVGLGDPSAPFGQAPVAPGAPLPGGLLAGTARDAAAGDNTCVHPGVVAAAEAEAVRLQLAVLRAAGLPEAALGRLVVAATGHTDVKSITYAHPEMEELHDGRWLLHVHVKIHFRSLDPVPKPHLCPFAPELWLKLRGADYVAAILGLPEPSSFANPKPAALNAQTLERALAAAPPDVAERYRSLGRPMEFGDDVDWCAKSPDGTFLRDAPSFLRESRITYTFPPMPPGALPAGGPPFGAPGGPPPAGAPGGPPAAGAPTAGPPVAAAPGTAGGPPPGSGGLAAAAGPPPTGAAAGANGPPAATGGSPPAGVAAVGGPPGVGSPPLPQPMVPAPPPSVPVRLLGAVRVASPFVSLPAPPGVAGLPPAAGRFSGVFYAKVLSTAQAMEWVWVDCLRAIDTPW
ncbi:hypothetical protein HYH03_001661 [Edaphochlamys debaryana]|uniref:Uncharacterized protein n=1 Tax=Edaphochlamys debaryana TaxID=47281 RepID=A0A835YFR0_9CHLO|nr:hypothetical protein HYH03_001661 [Edaphochlamys debaryana]|eukprot:KAG2500902.1 hypothetical protein HYH03_001661 [Edaphochlamys debaryana]